MTKKDLDADSIRAFRTGGLKLFERFDRRLGISQIVKPYKRRGVPLDGIVKIFCSQWTTEPASVRQTVAQTNENAPLLEAAGMEALAERTSYRALAIVGENAEAIYGQIFAQVCAAYGIDLRTVYQDFTSTFLNGESCRIAKRGFSKDHRPDKPQVKIGLAVSGAEPAIPILSSVAEGNMHDAKHFGQDFEQLKGRLSPGSLIVLDKGADSKANRELIRDAGFHFLTAAKVHEPLKAKIREKRPELKEILAHQSGEKILATEWEEEGLHYTLYLDERRKASDARRREARIAKAEKEWAELAETLKKGGPKALQRKLRLKRKKSLATPDYVIEQSVVVQRRLSTKKDLLERLNADADLDGMFVLVTSKKLGAKEALKLYRKKAAIEKMISDMKSVLRLRPLRVWTPAEIAGLLLLKILCVLLLSLLQLERAELRDLAKSTLVLMLKNLTVVLRIAKDGTKSIVGYDCRHKILAKVFCLGS